MVMNRHRFGDSHGGAPLSSIAISTAWSPNNKTVGNSPFPFKIDLEPGIINEDLMVHATQRLFFVG